MTSFPPAHYHPRHGGCVRQLIAQEIRGPYCRAVLRLLIQNWELLAGLGSALGGKSALEGNTAPAETRARGGLSN